MSENAPLRRHGVMLAILSGIGLLAAFVLTVEKLHQLADPEAAASCDLSVMVQCSANLASWQGEVFGFPNPLIGVVGWPVVVALGVLTAADVRLPRFVHIGLNAGAAFAFGFVAWLISQSIFVLGTLCPWCMVTWAVAIPFFYAVTVRNAREGVFGLRLIRAGRAAAAWVPLAAILSYAAIAVIAQLRLDILGTL